VVLWVVVWGWVVGLWVAPGENCGAVNQLLDEHIGHVEDRIRELRVLQKQLRKLRDQCPESTSAADCGILEGIEAAAAEPGAAQPSHRLGHVRGSHHVGDGRPTAIGTQGGERRGAGQRRGGGTQRP
jgi:hypothetical protein